MGELEKNINLNKESFLYELNYLESFNDKKLSLLISDIVKKIEILSEENIATVRNDVIIKYLPHIFHIYDRILKLLVSHYDSNDLFKIKNFHFRHYEMVERLGFVIKCFFEKQPYSRILDYEDELGKLVDDIENEKQNEK